MGDRFPKTSIRVTMGLRKMSNVQARADFTMVSEPELRLLRAKRVPESVMSRFLLFKSKQWLLTWTYERCTAGFENIATSEICVCPTSSKQDYRLWSVRLRVEIYKAVSFVSSDLLSLSTLQALSPKTKLNRMNVFCSSTYKIGQHTSMTLSHFRWV